MSMRRIPLTLLILLLLPLAAFGHVGSKDVFETVHAGPYLLNVTVRPPNVIPGVATVEIRNGGAAISSLLITPLPMTGEAAKHPPAADIMIASKADPAFYTGGVWIMAAGPWQVHLEIDGAAGRQSASVPVLAVPLETLKMQPAMGWGLAALGTVLVLSMGGIVAASFREARLQPGLSPAPKLRRRSLVAMTASLAVMTFFVFLGAKWWNVEAASYAENIYRRPVTSVVLKGRQMDLLVANFRPNADRSSRQLGKRLNDDYLSDHGKLIHLYAIRTPEMDAAYHLHPSLVAPGDFRMSLPAMPAGTYQVYGDVVHANGFPETLLARMDVSADGPAVPLAADDAEAHPAPLSKGPLGPAYRLPDGYTMIWDQPAQLQASIAYAFRFRLVDPQGRPATQMQHYLGMAGHAAFVKTDGTVFAHTHPEGSAAMPDVMLTNPMGGMEDPGPIAPVVEFPYGFPGPGKYRIFVQMKHAGTVETGVFDAQVR